MKLEHTFLAALLGEAGASALARRDGDWKPKTKNPHFFSLFVDDPTCTYSNEPYGQTSPSTPACTFEGYAIRLDKGRVIATPYNKWWDPPLPVLFVDDDTQFYTVSKDPLQFYIDSISGALKYTKVGWLPPNAISVSFYHTGDNPLGLIQDAPSYLSWPSTPQKLTNNYAVWLFCELGGTGQYQIFINNSNFDPQGAVNTANCQAAELAAVNANPWAKKKQYPKPPKDDDYDDKDDYGKEPEPEPTDDYGKEPEPEPEDGGY